MNENSFLTDLELAERLHVSVHLLRTLRCRGQGPPVTRIRSCVRYRWPDVEAWLATQAHPGPAPGPSSDPKAACGG
jgi:hypothetical protein